MASNHGAKETQQLLQRSSGEVRTDGLDTRLGGKPKEEKEKEKKKDSHVL